MYEGDPEIVTHGRQPAPDIRPVISWRRRRSPSTPCEPWHSHPATSAERAATTTGYGHRQPPAAALTVSLTAATLDILGDGRFDLGIGTGAQQMWDSIVSRRPSTRRRAIDAAFLDVFVD